VVLNYRGVFDTRDNVAIPIIRVARYIPSYDFLSLRLPILPSPFPLRIGRRSPARSGTGRSILQVQPRKPTGLSREGSVAASIRLTEQRPTSFRDAPCSHVSTHVSTPVIPLATSLQTLGRLMPEQPREAVMDVLDGRRSPARYGSGTGRSILQVRPR